MQCALLQQIVQCTNGQQPGLGCMHNCHANANSHATFTCLLCSELDNQYERVSFLEGELGSMQSELATLQQQLAANQQEESIRQQQSSVWQQQEQQQEQQEQRQQSELYTLSNMQASAQQNRDLECGQPLHKQPGNAKQQHDGNSDTGRLFMNSHFCAPDILGRSNGNSNGLGFGGAVGLSIPSSPAVLSPAPVSRASSAVGAASPVHLAVGTAGLSSNLGAGSGAGGGPGHSSTTQSPLGAALMSRLGSTNSNGYRSRMSNGYDNMGSNGLSLDLGSYTSGGLAGVNLGQTSMGAVANGGGGGAGHMMSFSQGGGYNGMNGVSLLGMPTAHAAGMSSLMQQLDKVALQQQMQQMHAAVGLAGLGSSSQLQDNTRLLQQLAQQLQPH